MSNSTRGIRTTIKVISVVTLYVISILLGILLAAVTEKPAFFADRKILQDTVQYEKEPEETAKDSEVTVVFSKSDIPHDVREKMQGVTISGKSRVSFDDLSYLTVTHIGYDGKLHTGNIIVDRNLAEEVLSIFKELYEAGFPIERMELASEYDGVDELSMRANNTSSFNDRPVTGGTGLSYHQLGRAIDINPLVNPYIKGDTVLPETAAKYTDRTLMEKGMISADSECVRIFKKYGWAWGGDWKSLKDYQHFEKK